MNMTVHGYCKVTPNKVVLGFIDNPPAFEPYKDLPTHVLVEAQEHDKVVGYTVVAEDDNHGFLYYPVKKAAAELLTTCFTSGSQKQYRCVPLAVGAVKS